MKVKTFILTFLMMMSSPFLFGQQHWDNPGNLGLEEVMKVSAKVVLDGSPVEGTYQVAAFSNTTLLGVGNITAMDANGTTIYHVDIDVPGESGMTISFRFFKDEKEYVSLTKVPFDAEGYGIHSALEEIKFESVAQIGNVVYPSIDDAIAAVGAGDVVIELLADATFDYNARDAYGTASTESLTINGNGKILTLNQKNSDWSSFGLANANAKVVFNNMTIEKTGYGDTSGAWNTHAIIFSSNVEMNNVTVNNSMAVQKGATLDNVTINEANAYYGLWINGNGQKVTMNGGSITATNGGRGIKIADQYIDSPASVTLSVEGTKFNTAKKAAVLVSSKAGAAITASSNVNIENVAEDKVNFVWVDEDWAADYGKVTVTDASLSQENLPAFTAAIMNGDNVKGYYKTLPEAITAAQTNNVVTILAGNHSMNVDINKPITVQGATDEEGNNLVNIAGKLNITADGATAKNLNVDNGNSTAGYISAKNVTVDGCKVVGGNGFRYCYTSGTVTFSNSTITGSTYGIHFDGSAGGNIVIENCVIKGWTSFARTIKKVTMTETSFEEGDYNYVRFYQEEVVIEKCTFNENMQINIAVDGNTTTVNNCTFENGNVEDLFYGKDIVKSTIIVDGVTLSREASIGNTYYKTLADAFKAAQNDDEVKILVAGTYALSTSGKNITITGAVDGVVFDNIGAKDMGRANVTFNNVTFDYYPNVNYTGLQHSGDLVYNNCTINGQVFLYGTSETFNNCTFNQNSADAYNVWTYGAKEVAFNECAFNSVGKSVMIYSEDKNLFNNVAVTKCTFKASAQVEGKAAIEMDSSLTAGINLKIDGATTATGFGSGNVSGNSLWNNKKGNQGANNDITVTVNDVVVLAPTTVAKIGETEYQLLQNAVNAATATDVINVVGTTTENITIAENANITLNFAENVVLNGYIAPFKGNLTIKGGTINNTNSSKSAIEINAGNLNLENVKVTSARHGIRIDGTVVATISGGEYHGGKTTGTRHALNVSGAANVRIIDGTFVGPKGTPADSGAAIQVQAGSIVTIEGGDFSGGKNNTLSVKGEMEITGGTFDQDPSAYMQEGYFVRYDELISRYVVYLGVAKIGDVSYGTLASAIAAAQPGNTIVFCADITEDVTVSKSVTIDGANFKYTGTMTGNAALTITVEKVAFNGGGFAKTAKSSTGIYTIKNCTFEDNGDYAYSLIFKGANKVVVEDCTVKNYKYSFLYITSGTNTVSVKDVTVEDCPSYAVYFASGVNKATIEGLTVKNSSNGFIINNTANRALTIKDCKLENVTTAINHANGENTITCTMSGENDFGTSALSDYATIVLKEANATLAAQEGLVVTTTVEGCVVEYEDGVYSVVPANIELVRDGASHKKFATLQDAIDYAIDGDVIVILKDIDLNETECVLLDNSYDTYFKVEGKSVTVNLNGKKISGSYTGTNTMLVGVFSTDNNGHLTLIDENIDETETTAEINVTATNIVYSLIANYESGCSITINGGNYILDNASDSHLFTGGNEGIIVNGGTFILGNVGTGTNGKPWMFNGLGQNSVNAVVNGGTFSTDVNHQFWANEVYVPEAKALSQNTEGTWTVVDAVAYVEEEATSTNSSPRNVGYASIADAIASEHVKANSTITVIKEHTLAETVIVNKNVNFEFAENVQITAPAYSYENGVHKNPTAFRIINDATVTVNSFNITSGDNGLYNFILGAADGEAGNLVINDGTFVANTSVASVTKGTLTIQGGDFSLVEGTTDYRYLINCIDANYTAGTAKVAIKGGTFHKFNPRNNAAEGIDTNFCPFGYTAIYDEATETYTVIPAQEQSLVKGWNWYSSYLKIDGEQNFGKLTSALGENGLEIKSQDDGYVFYEVEDWYGNLTYIDLSKMYMIRTSNACTLNIAAPVANPSDYTISLKGSGWTWIGYPSNVGVDINSAFNFKDGKKPAEGDVIKSQNNGSADYAYGQWWGTLSTMVPGVGYQYKNVAGETREFVYNVSAKGSTEANITSENNYWAPDSRLYPNTMTMTAMLNIDGEMMDDNYEIAAFVNGEVRGSARPIYVEPMDAYIFFLTIHGDEVEELTFMCRDLASGESYLLNDRFNYTNDAHLGSVKEPYVFSRGTMGIGEASLSEINIYPNPTTTGREINLQATCDKVEVFNALGVMVAEYQNVDSIDAFETAGIYVIRLTNNGDVKHCRLIVR